MKSNFLIEFYIEKMPCSFMFYICKLLNDKILISMNKEFLFFKKEIKFYSRNRILFIFEDLNYYLKNFYCYKYLDIEKINKKIIKSNKILFKDYKFYILRYNNFNKNIIFFIINFLKTILYNIKKININENIFFFINSIKKINIIINNRLFIFYIDNNSINNINYYESKSFKINDYLINIKKKNKLILDYNLRKNRLLRIIRNKLKVIKNSFINFKNKKNIINNLSLLLEYPKVYIIKLNFKVSKNFINIYKYIINNKFKSLEVYINNSITNYILFFTNNNIKKKNIFISNVTNNINNYFNDIFNLINIDNRLNFNLIKKKKNINLYNSLYNKYIRIKKNFIFLYKYIIYYDINNNFLIDFLKFIFLDKFYSVTNLSYEYNNIHYIICLYYYNKSKNKSKIIKNNFYNIFYIKKKNIYNIYKNVYIYLYILLDEFDNIIMIIYNNKNYVKNIQKTDILEFRKSLNIIINILINNKILIHLKYLLKSILNLYNLLNFNEIFNLLINLIYKRIYNFYVKNNLIDKNIFLSLINNIYYIKNNFILYNLNYNIEELKKFIVKNKYLFSKILFFYKRIDKLILSLEKKVYLNNIIINYSLLKTYKEKKIFNLILDIYIYNNKNIYFYNNSKLYNKIYNLLLKTNLFLNKFNISESKMYFINRLKILKNVIYIIKYNINLSFYQ
ncbi:glycine--tRNA ligase subunit beta [Candidatus Nardonella dryophthoridicola]|uniref:Glycyl-tRNA synthetase beta subunit n=1 Tax=endosymbiont of Rhynchophorus ferrugineus TaxID=1972133 RepID=A0A2Z5TH65_9GAMM|nr:glycine--tRNA ligase subunit beta [Candidatus Nardonella dryophthoridicola]BBA85133.1 glycyl-tRNA synthetase beta subunit [endosymbiont of Rhynchophorus ferrugineus]